MAYVLLKRERNRVLELFAREKEIMDRGCCNSLSIVLIYSSRFVIRLSNSLA